MRFRLPILFAFGAFATATSCGRDDDPEIICDPGQQQRPLKIVLLDSLSGANLLLPGGRYPVEAIRRKRTDRFAPAELYEVERDTSGGEMGFLIEASGIWQGCEIVYNPRAATLDSIIVVLSSTDEDTLTLCSTASGSVEVRYNEVLRATSGVFDESKQTVTVTK